MKKYLGVLLICFLGMFSISSAGNEWHLDSVDMVTREERGANEKRKYREHEEYQKIIEERKEYQEYVKQLKETNFKKYLEIKKKQYREKQRNEYLKENFWEEIKIDKSKEQENGKELWWPKSYKHQKNKIILHHTDTDLNELKNVSDVKEVVRAIHRNHSFTRGWGDIGYNFVIGPFGKVYEGRDGGKGVIGAHTKRNNSASIGISMIGDFQKQKPKKAQLKSLIFLLTELTQEYNIDPFSKTVYHKKIREEPFIKEVIDYSIAGHGDASRSSCPGEKFHKMLDRIRSIVKKRIGEEFVSSSKGNQNNTGLIDEKTLVTKEISKSFSIKGDSHPLNLDVEIDGELIECGTSGENVSVSDCSYTEGTLMLNLAYQKPLASGTKTLVLETSQKRYEIDVTLWWRKDLDYFLKKRKKQYKKEHNFSKPNKLFEKISSKLSPEKAKEYLDKRVKVLLYDLTQNHNSRQISCEQKCNLVVDGVEFNNVSSLYVQDNGNNLTINIEGKNPVEGNSIDIYSSDRIVFENYERESYAGIPWNVFRGNIFIKKDTIDPLGGEEKQKYVLINQLDFQDYMKGVAEVNDQSPMEKIKSMSVLIRNYVLFYLDKENKHPSIPEESNYNLVDDARIFQKYVGAGFEDTASKWFDALEETKGKVVVYDDYIPILPYFNCSAGFTWSAQEKFGWKDTPFLESKIDFHKCKDFKGHGVGLSGKGAEFLAQKGKSYKTIINYYYDGISIKKIK